MLAKMSKATPNNGSPRDVEGQQLPNNKADQRAMTMGRPSPINTALINDVKKQPLTATTASSNGYSPSINTGSSVQFTPATSAGSVYSPSIWSDGAGTPMSVAENPDKSSLSEKTEKNAAFPLARKPSRTTPETPSKAPDQSTHAAQGSAAPIPPHHISGELRGVPYVVVYYDETGAFYPYKMPLSRDASGRCVDANGQQCLPPKGAQTITIGGSSAVASGNDAEPPKGTFSPKNDGVTETYTVVASPYEVKSEPVTPFIEVDTVSVGSDITPHYTKTHPQLAGQKPMIFAEESGGGNFKVQLNDNLAVFEEAFPNAINIVKALNPSHMQMAYGDRVICIKTEYVSNIYWSVTRGVWAAMDKVGERINRLLESCQKGERVFLIFSVNGQKSYCGLAILSGQWVAKSSEELEGWAEREDGTKTMGTLPVTWTHVKNVPYEYFKDITHTHSGQPIVNMWNGMHFPLEKGREVLELFVKKAHYTNLLAYRGDRPYHPFKEITHPAQLDPRLKTTQNDMTIMKKAINARQAPLGGSNAATVSQAHQQSPGVTTPTIRGPRGINGSNLDTAPPNLDGSASPSPLPGQRVSCIVDADGNLVPVTPTRPQNAAVQMTNGNNSVMPSGQGNTHYAQPPQYSTRGRGGYAQGFRGNLAGRGGMNFQLRGAASFTNPSMMHLHQNGYGRGMPHPLHGAHSFDNGFHGFVQELPKAPMSPAVHRMQSQMGTKNNVAMIGNPYGGMYPMAFAPQMQRTQSAQYGPDVLRQAVTKANMFIPSMAQAPSAQATGFMPFTPGFNNAVSKGIGNQPCPKSSVGASSTAESYSYVPPVEYTPFHSSRTGYGSSTSINSAQNTAPKTSTTDSTLNNDQSVEDIMAKMKAKENEMLAMSKYLIHAQGEWSSMQHMATKALKAKGLISDKEAASPPDPNNMSDGDSEGWAWMPRYAMGSGSTLERRYVSPVRNSDGGILDSVSKHDSPETKAARREINHRERLLYGQCDDATDVSMEKRIIADCENVVSSPQMSVAGARKEGEEVGGGVSLE